MTYTEACQLPTRARVRLFDGRVGRIVLWHAASQSVAVRVPGLHGMVSIPAARLDVAADGTIEERPPTAH